MDFYFTITAETLPGKLDAQATGQFTNLSRAEQYGAMLKATGDYLVVTLTENATSEKVEL